MSLLGIDVGITGCKSIVFSEDGDILAMAYREYPLHRPEPAWMELDPNQVMDAVRSTISESVRKAGPRDPVRALSVSSHAEAVTPVAKSGEFLANAIAPFDNRTIPQAEWWEREVGRKRIFEITGQPLHPMYSINKIMWWRENDPVVYDSAWKFLCFEDLVIWKLCGEPATDHSIAARTMVFDLRERVWSCDLLNRANVDAGLLATHHPSGTVVGEVKADLADELGLPKGVKVATGGHDQVCGALGAGIVREGLAMDATGTVECITPAFPRPILTDAMLDGNYCCYEHVIPGLYATLAFNFTGGSILRWYRDNFGRQEIEEAEISGLDVYDIVIGKAAKGPIDLFVLPHFTVTGTPWFDPLSRGAILGLSLSTTNAHLIKAMLDGVTFEMRLNLEWLEDAGIGINELRAIGGGAKSWIWLQLKANIFDMPVSSLNVSEAACLGAAILAGAGAGVYPSAQEAANRIVKVVHTFEPERAEADRYAEQFGKYKRIYPMVRDFMHDLGI
jgi:xylulokinase